jgi:glycosyl transferase family 2
MNVLALTLVVRDESDILAANLDYHLAQGVDVILAIDHGSSDGTTGILREYERSTGRVRSFREEARPHDQARRVNRLLQMAAKEHAADWVIHCDADEFWIPAAGSLRDVFAAIPERYGYIQVARHNFLPSGNGNGNQPFHQRMVVRHRHSVNLRGTTLEPKIAQRPSAGAKVAHGNHDLETPVLDRAPDIGAVEVLHFPARSFEQFEQKVIKTGVGYEQLEDRPPDVGCDQLELLDLYRSGTLPDYYRSEALAPGQVQAGLERGELVVDARLQALMKAARPPVQESAAIQELLHRVWTSVETLTDALSAAESQATERAATITALDAQLRDAQAEAQALANSLSVVRNSRIMRYSEPARRAYYRVRGTRAPS